jgi:hypothetical protein
MLSYEDETVDISPLTVSKHATDLTEAELITCNTNAPLATDADNRITHTP